MRRIYVLAVLAAAVLLGHVPTSHAAQTCTITGTAGNDVLVGTAGPDVICGLSGNDRIDGRGGDDVIDGGPGNDTLTGGDGDDTIDGRDGNDTLTFAATTSDLTVDLTAGTSTGQGSDTVQGVENVTGSNGNDTLTGSSAANTLLGGAGNNALHGLGANDKLVGGAGDDALDGGEGTDTLTFTATTSNLTVDLTAGTSTGQGSDTVQGVENVTGSNGNDTLTGSSTPNTLLGGAGNDALHGLGANDKLDGGTGDDTIDGGSENDTLIGGIGDDTIDGAAGTDTLTFAATTSDLTVDLTAGTSTGQGSDTVQGVENVTGSNGNDTLTGSTTANTLLGGAGNDALHGLGANDKLDGGTGDDTIDGGSENDTLIGGIGIDTIDGGAGTDTLAFAATTSDLTVDLTAGTSTGQGSDTVQGVENVTGSNGNDTLTGSSTPNTLLGGAGNDALHGLGANDKLDGGTGDDTIDGGSENDTLIGGIGIDTIDGGAGNDTVTGLAGDDTIDGAAGADKLDGGDGNDTVRGGDGNDTLNGRDGNDSLQGDAGDDVLHGGLGDDYLDGGEGTNMCTGDGGLDELLPTCDGAPPQVVSFSVTPDAVDTTAGPADVTVTARITDDGSGVASAYVSFEHPSVPMPAGADLVLVSGTALDGVYEAHVRVPRYSASGRYSPVVELHDNGGHKSVVHGRTTSLGTGSTFTDSGTEDVRPPTVLDPVLSRETVDTSTGDELVTVTARIADDLSGVASALVTFENPGSSTPPSAELVRVSGDERDGTYEARVTVPQGSPPGTYRPVVQARDALGNLDFLSSDDLASLSTAPTTFSNNPASAPSPTANPTGEFYVVGSRIIDPQGQVFVPVGANVGTSMNFDPAGDAAGHADQAAAWGWNTVRLNLRCTTRPGWTGSRATMGYQYLLDEVDAVVREYTARHIVVMLECHDFTQDVPDFTTVPPSQDTYVQQVDQFWTDMASRYGSNPYVWFNALNEVGKDDPANWLAAERRYLDIVRSHGAENVFVADVAGGGNDAARGVPKVYDPQMGPALAAGACNVLFSLHNYGTQTNSLPGQDGVSRVDTDVYRAYWQRVQAAGLSMIVGEFGLHYLDDFTTEPGGGVDFQNTSNGVNAASFANGEYATVHYARDFGIGLLSWHATMTDINRLAVPTAADPTPNFYNVLNQAGTDFDPSVTPTRLARDLWAAGHDQPPTTAFTGSYAASGCASAK